MISVFFTSPFASSCRRRWNVLRSNKPFMDFSALLPFTNWLLLWISFLLFANKNWENKFAKQPFLLNRMYFFRVQRKEKNVKIVWKIFFRFTFPWIPWGIMWMLCHGNEKSFWLERFREMKSFLLKLSKALFCDEFVKVRDYKSFKWWWPSVDFWVVKNNPVSWCYGTKDFHLGRPSYC